MKISPSRNCLNHLVGNVRVEGPLILALKRQASPLILALKRQASKGNWQVCWLCHEKEEESTARAKGAT